MSYENHQIKISCSANRAGRKSLNKQIEIDLSNFKRDSLIYLAIRSYSFDSAACSKNLSTAQLLRKSVTTLETDSIEFCNSSPILLNRETFCRGIASVEADLHKVSSWSLETKKRVTAFFRGILCRCPGNLGDGTAIENALGKYQRSRSRLPSQAATFTNQLVSTIEHDSIDDLRKKTLQQVISRIQEIENACIAEMQIYEDVFDYQKQLLLLKIPQYVRDDLLKLLGARGSIGKVDIERWHGHDDDHVIAVCLQFVDSIRKYKVSERGFYDRIRLPSTRTIKTAKELDRYTLSSSTQPWFFVRQRLPNRVLVAIFLLLLTVTAWNPTSLGQMTTEGITFNGRKLTLQGYKSRSDDHTPIYEVPAGATWIRKAVDLLTWNLDQLKAHGVVPKDEIRLWFGWQLGGYDQIADFTHASHIEAFCAAHNLPRFVPSELRPLKAAEVYLSEDDLEAVRLLLGHIDLSSTNGYLKNTLFFHLNEARALRFQRTIEATIVFSALGEEKLDELNINRKYVSDRLLSPTGDGGMCSDPMSPPHLAPDADEMCDGMHCHDGEGCKRYQLVVDAISLEMAVRTREFYRSRWEELLHRNHASFKELHVPRIIFVHILLKVVAERNPLMFNNAVRKFHTKL